MSEYAVHFLIEHELPYILLSLEIYPPHNHPRRDLCTVKIKETIKLKHSAVSFQLWTSDLSISSTRKRFPLCHDIMCMFRPYYTRLLDRLTTIVIPFTFCYIKYKVQVQVMRDNDRPTNRPTGTTIRRLSVLLGWI